MKIGIRPRRGVLPALVNAAQLCRHREAYDWTTLNLNSFAYSRTRSLLFIFAISQLPLVKVGVYQMGEGSDATLYIRDSFSSFTNDLCCPSYGINMHHHSSITEQIGWLYL